MAFSLGRGGFTDLIFGSGMGRQPGRGLLLSKKDVAMPIRNVDITEHLETLHRNQYRVGCFFSASEALGL